MSNFDKRLKKAKDLYESKNYKEVLKICDKILEKEYNNEEALELEGEALLKLGRIEEAVLNWQINAEYNNNPTAKMRLEDVDDETKQRALNLTLNLSNLSKIINSEAKKIEKQKKEAKKLKAEKEEAEAKAKNNTKPVQNKPNTEKGSIENEVSKKETKPEPKKQATNNIEDKRKPLIKKEDKKAEKIINKENTNTESNSNKTEKDSKKENVKTNDLNVSNKEAKKETTVDTISKKDKPSNKGKKSAIIAACALIVVVSAYVGIKHFKAPSNNDTATQEQQNTEKKQMSAEELNSKLSDAISKNDYNAIYNLLEENPQNTITDATKENYDKALDLMKTKGVEKFYNEGLDQYKFKTYDKALDSFTKAYKYCGGTYLEPHILYFLGSTYNSMDKKDDGAKYFQEYLDKYPHSDLYTAEILYNLSLYYHNKGDNEKAKQYAQRIENSYPSSPYYNDVTKDILYK